MEQPFLLGAGADPIWSEPELAPGPRTSGAGAAQKSGGSATLQGNVLSKGFDSRRTGTHFGYTGTDMYV